MPNPADRRNLLGIDPQALEERIALRREILAGKGERLARLKARTEGNAGSVGAFPGVLTDAGNGLVTIRICGEMAPERDDWLTYLGVEQAVYSELIPACDTAAGNPLVRGVLLDIDSPGGMVEGFEDFFLSLQRLTAAKPCVGIARCCASLGMFASFALATENLAAVNDGRLGSIGIMYDMEDSSKAYEMMGIRRVIVASGKNKGTYLGAAGLPITPEMEQNVMSVLVAPTFARFKAAAIAARGAGGLADNSPVFDGRVLTPAEALGFGLIGKTGTTDDIQRWAGERLTALIAAEDTNMSDDKSKTTGQNPPAKPGDKPADPPAPKGGGDAPAGAVGLATLEELEAEFGDEPKFVLDALKGKMTMADAAKGYAKLQKAKLQGVNETLATVRGELETAKANGAPGTPGNKKVHTAPPGTGGAKGAGGDEAVEDTGDAADYVARLAVLKGSMATGKAVAQAQKEMPKGYAAWRTAKGLG